MEKRDFYDTKSCGSPQIKVLNLQCSFSICTNCVRLGNGVGSCWASALQNGADDLRALVLSSVVLDFLHPAQEGAMPVGR